MSINYIIEDNLDFNAALLNLDGEETTANENELISVIPLDPTDANAICLISHQPLTKSHIQLPCTHRFNYKPLFQEVCTQKLVQNMYNPVLLKTNQLKCPYCRSISEHLLPYLPSEKQVREYGVNGPAKYCMPYTAECEYKAKSKTCANPACYIGKISYCKAHYLKVQKGLVTASTLSVTIPWSPAMIDLCNTKTVIELKQILRTHKLLVGGKKKELVERIFTNNIPL
jgi:hypothetical protein